MGVSTVSIELITIRARDYDYDTFIFCTGNGSSNSRYVTPNTQYTISNNILQYLNFTLCLVMKCVAGQKLGKLGEEYSLNFEKFPNVGLLKVRQLFNLRLNPHQIVRQII